MKKLFLSIAVLASAMMVNAQAEESAAANEVSKEVVESNEFKTDPHHFALEVGFSPVVVNLGENNENGVNLLGGQLRGVYVLTEQVELKLGVGFSVNKQCEDNAKEGDQWQAESTRISRFSINPGVSYVFPGTKRLSPYVGGELGFGFETTKSVYETEESKIISKNINNHGFNRFEVLALSGFNFYFSKNIFIGAEVGFGFGMSFQKGQKITTEVNGEKEVDERQIKEHELEFNPMVVPSIRLGWSF